MTIKTLVERCQSGDDLAFNELLEQQYDTMFATAWHWCGDETNAQDITQNACLKLARGIQQFDGRANFSTWLHRLVINCAKDYYKSPKQHNVREEQHDQLDQLGPKQADHLKTLEARQTIALIGELAEELAETLILVFIQGLSHQQAAKQLGIKTNTVSWRVHEARKQLNELNDVSAGKQEVTPAGVTQ